MAVQNKESGSGLTARSGCNPDELEEELQAGIASPSYATEVTTLTRRR